MHTPGPLGKLKVPVTGVLTSGVVCTLLYAAGTIHSVLIEAGGIISGVPF